MSHKVLCPYCRCQVATDKQGRRLWHLYYHEAGQTRCWGSQVGEAKA